jgi:aspartyl-tRNA(Asn)/glutamyl-tRNA(Gln) amidotransferase subunit C
MKVSKINIKKLADLSKLKVDKKEESYFEKQFDETLKIVSEFEKVGTSNTPPTYIVTGTKNVMREDMIDSTRILSQEEALSNAKKTHNGYFVVDAILNEN